MHGDTVGTVIVSGVLAWHQTLPGDVSSGRYASVAQQEEQLICNQQVAGSIPVSGSIHSVGVRSGHLFSRYKTWRGVFLFLETPKRKVTHAS